MGALVSNQKPVSNDAKPFDCKAQSMTRWRGKVHSFDIQQNLVATIKRTLTRKPKGQRFLNETEVQELWFTNLLTSQMHLALKFILSTGQRVEEVLHATWDEFDLLRSFSCSSRAQGIP